MKDKTAANFGRLFEIGFNVGILSFIQQQKLKHKFSNVYEEDLGKIKLSQIKKKIVKDSSLINPQDEKILEKWILFFLEKGFLSGFNLFREYLDSIVTRQKYERLEIVYCQCNFIEESSFSIISNKSEKENFPVILSQLGEFEVNIDRYSQKGEFLRADTLILIRHHDKRKFHLLVVDLSVFSVKSLKDVKDLDNVENWKQILLTEISYLRSKSVFSSLNIDTGEKDNSLGVNFDKDLTNYYQAFKRQDKETVKLIQAGSYGYSFYQFLLNHKILTTEDEIKINVMGYSDRSVNSIAVTAENLNLLKTCQYIYQREEKQDIFSAKRKVVKTIKYNAAKSFTNGRKFINSLLEITPSEKPQLTTISHEEKITNFVNSIDEISPDLQTSLHLPPNLTLRDAHAYLICQALNEDNLTYLFLTGNPGIGKTTAIVKFLQEYFEDGFLFLYISPRTQVNLDIIHKFSDIQQKELIAINSNANLITSNQGKPTIQYFSDSSSLQGDFRLKNVEFIDGKNKTPRQAKVNQQIRQKNQDTWENAGKKTVGVLNSLCQGICAIIQEEKTRNLVATISIQSLKKLNEKDDTLKHLEKIFDSAYNQRENQVIPSKMSAIASRFKHFFIMIDEITGDSSGVEFLSGVTNFFRQYNLFHNPYGFNAKIIIADASIVDKKVINQHLEKSSIEPDKIYYRGVNSEILPLSATNFEFNQKPAKIINTNSYPSKNLTINYQIFLETKKFTESLYKEKTNNLTSRLQQAIISDINRIFAYPENQQVIVYIQDKSRLQDLITQLEETNTEFTENKDYLQIHSNNSEADKQKIKEYQNHVKIIFMTASGSRGLSFPKARHILVDIPRFNIEANLMEIIQVIYRGRGEFFENGEKITNDDKDKFLTFYLWEEVIFDDEKEAELSLQEKILNVVNLLLLLKAAIMTRIKGYGNIGNHRYLIIPIGGKSVSSVGETFSGKMKNLITLLDKEYKINYKSKVLREVSDKLKSFLGKTDFLLKWIDKNPQNNPVSYLNIRESFSDKFIKSVNNNVAELLNIGMIEPSFISGNMLIIPLVNRQLKETYELNLQQEINQYLLSKLRYISQSDSYNHHLTMACYHAIELLEKMKKNDTMTKWFQQNSQQFDQYYAFPFLLLINPQIIKEYLATEVEEKLGEENSFRTILQSYLRYIFPLQNVLPIGSYYHEFPFLLFNSFSFNLLRHKLFTDKQIFSSCNLNILNLILCQEN
ncbi:helicase-related protein [Geminocystis sp. GBBB08]|uniref:helicase-related protein n=1 Tax=Geminocystis sp. GBBB08 TaxID=2604140 RepID=UPI0027E2A298|nr:helicase-related protein [Geminocystis sp. GBBB08]MBL1208808.1 helicase [Geminocystis sp. GBBB08]